MKNYIILFIALITLNSCNSKMTDDSDLNSDSDSLSIKNSVEMSAEQIEMAGVMYGALIKKTVSNTIDGNGEITVPLQHIVKINAPVGGFVKSLKVSYGDYVEKGQLIATLQHPDYYTLQQEYLVAKSKAEFHHEEFKRQGELAIENAASIKKMQQAKADYLTFDAKWRTAKAMLEMLGIDINKLNDGEIQSKVDIYTPISGYITEANTSIGQFAGGDEYLFEVINPSALFLNVKIYEKDILKVKKGNKVTFSLINNANRVFEAKVAKINQKVNLDRTIDVRCKINGELNEYRSGMFVNSSIHIDSKDVVVLPIAAIAYSERQSFIFIGNGGMFNKVLVETGVEDNNMIEILNPPDDILNSKQIVIKGAYNIMAVFAEE